MNTSENGRYHLFREPQFGAAFIGDTPEQIVETTRHYNERPVKPKKVVIPSPEQIVAIDRLILGGVRDNDQFLRAIDGGREAKEEFFRKIGTPGSVVKRKVVLAPGVDILLDEFAKEIEDRTRSGTLDNRKLRGKLYVSNWIGGPDKLAYHKIGTGEDEFGVTQFTNLYLPQSIMSGIGIAGLGYRNRDAQNAQLRQSTEKRTTERGWRDVLRKLFSGR
jgi:hypothetical protein